TIPDLIRALEDEKVPNYRDGGAWNQVYSGLYHQHSLYARTYAAFPHIVPIADTGTLAQRLAILCLAGNIRVHGCPDESIPDDLLTDFASALDRVKETSLRTVRESARAKALDEWTTLGDLLEAFGGLRHPQSGFVAHLGHLVREGWHVEPGCPSCGHGMVARLEEQVITTLRLLAYPQGTGGEDYTDPEAARMTPVDRSGSAGLIARGRAVLTRGDADWALEDTPNVLAALADECGDPLLAARILDLGAVVICAYCQERFELAQGLRER